MTRPDVYAVVMARMQARVEAEAYTVTCPVCLSKYDVRHWRSCLYCGAAKYQRDKRGSP